jgi:UDP-glucose 4-epimerase
VSRASNQLGWTASRNLHDMLESSWHAHLRSNEELAVGPSTPRLSGDS